MYRISANFSHLNIEGHQIAQEEQYNRMNPHFSTVYRAPAVHETFSNFSTLINCF